MDRERTTGREGGRGVGGGERLETCHLRRLEREGNKMGRPALAPSPVPRDRA